MAEVPATISQRTFGIYGALGKAALKQMGLTG